MTTNKTILIADDDQHLLRALVVRLKAEGYVIITAQDGYQALDFARRETPDLFILDINMPAGDGFSVQERLAKISDLAFIPVIYVTGESPGHIDIDAQEHNAFAVLHKPFETSELLELIASALGGKTDQRAA